jgi:hypothetical protein
MQTPMAAPNSTTLKFSILLIILYAFELREASFLNPRITVTIANYLELPPNHFTSLTFHCKSKNDDLGFHTIKFREDYSFSFRRNVFGGTLFFCSFTWPEDPRLHYLDIYDQSQHHCHECTWQINVNGGCLNSDDNCVTWKSVELMDATNTFMWQQRKGVVEQLHTHPPTF